MHIDHAVDFQIEALAWLEDFRGAEYIDRLEQLVIDHGPEEATRQTLHPNMCDQTRECYRAVIGYLAGLPAWRDLAL